MKGFTFATVAALAATAFSATVRLEPTRCPLTNTTSLAQFDVEADKLTVVELKSVCGLKIVSADGVDVKNVKCHAYRDAEGKMSGSSEFTFESPAAIATNPVQEGSILCVSSGNLPSGQPTTFAAVTTSAALAGPSSGATPSGNSTGGKPSSPTATPTAGPADNKGAASTLGMSFGALSAAVAAAMFFL